MLDIPAVLLVGGMGTRLRSLLPSTPKPLAEIGDKSFLELLICQLRHQGVRRLVMCTGYLAERIEREFGSGEAWGVEIEYSKELQPLGTGGAVKFSQKHLGDVDEFLVMNGDSFLETDFARLVRFHEEHGGIISMTVVQVADASRYGTVAVNADSRVIAFAEKTGSHCVGLINAGVYLFKRSIFDCLEEGPASLEKDVFPQLLSRGIYAQQQHGMFIDIGTPEDYKRAQELCHQLDELAVPKQPGFQARRCAD